MQCKLQGEVLTSQCHDKPCCYNYKVDATLYVGICLHCRSCFLELICFPSPVSTYLVNVAVLEAARERNIGLAWTNVRYIHERNETKSVIAYL